ncbi:MAG: hypothetical protein EB162_05235, partial [Euryarchaeota archaeon]|nr:hypothetical protein [Euryarchaeota archaeon]
MNDAPTSEDDSIQVPEDTVYLFSLADFVYNDVEGDAFSKIRLQQTTAGSLWVDHDENQLLNLGEEEVENNDEVSIANIPKLRFRPAANALGDNYATFLFEVHDGFTFSEQQYTMTVNVETFNDPPTSENFTITATEDIVYTFLPSSFAYDDIEDQPLSQIQFQPVTTGTFWVDEDLNDELNGAEEAIDTNSDIVAGDLSKLRFLAEPNGEGDNYATIDFKVFDGGVYSTDSYTVTINVTAVNDLPVSSDITLTALEDTPLGILPTDIPYSDIELVALDHLRLQTVSVGTLWLDQDDNNLLNGSEGAIIPNTLVDANDIGKLHYLAPEHESGVAFATVQFEINDGTEYAATPYILTFDVTAVNDHPTSADNTVTAVEDTLFTFAESDFPYADVEDEDLVKLQLQAVTDGTLWVDADDNGEINDTEAAIPNNAEVAVADIAKLKYIADEHDNGTAFASFAFKVHDGTDYSDVSYTMTINVTAVNDAPTSNSNSVVVVDEDTNLTFVGANFPYVDVENSPMTRVRLQQPTRGTIWLDDDGSGTINNAEAIMANGAEVDVDDLPSLTYYSDLNENNDETADPYATIEFEVHDGTVYSDASYTLTVDVNPVNDAPTSAPSTMTAIEDQVFSFADTDFPYTDVENDTFAQIRVHPVSSGTLWYDADDSGTVNDSEGPVESGDVIVVADIPLLKYLADQNDNGANHATFDFEVHDGDLYVAAPETMTIHVSSVNDLPTSADATVTATEDTVLEIELSDFPYTDV